MNFTSILKTMLPSLGAALPLPPPLGGMAAAAISKALGVEVKPETAEAQLEAAAAKDPDILLKLKEADQEFAVRLKEMDVDLERIAFQNTDSARGREIAIRDKTNRNLAYFTAMAFFGLLLLMIFHKMPDGAHDLLVIMLTTLANQYAAQNGYYFGSSKGSDDKTQIIANASKG